MLDHARHFDMLLCVTVMRALKARACVPVSLRFKVRASCMIIASDLLCVSTAYTINIFTSENNFTRFESQVCAFKGGRAPLKGNKMEIDLEKK